MHVGACILVCALVHVGFCVFVHIAVCMSVCACLFARIVACALELSLFVNVCMCLHVVS